MSIAEACKYHEGILQMDDKYTEEDMANSQINPPYRSVQYWYDMWRIKNLVPRTGQDLFEVSFRKDNKQSIFITLCIHFSMLHNACIIS